MYRLPYLELKKDILIPHPGSDYTLSYPLGLKVPTKNLTIDSVEYKNLFIYILEDVNSSICSLCLLQNVAYTQNEQLVYFTSINKVKLQKKEKNTCLVDFIDEKIISDKNKSYLNNLITFINQTKELEFISNSNSFQETDLTLCALSSFLFLTEEDSLRMYTLHDFKTRLNIIYNALFSTVTMIKNNLDNAGNVSKLPSVVQSKITNEEARLNNISPASPEYSATLDYLELLKSIPWTVQKEYTRDISLAENNLNNIHYGLDCVKDQFLDFLYLEKLTQVKTSACFLFDGPPGVGKTSLAKSLAKSFNRDFIFISLAGVSDEAEMRGHRRTYAGSKPGRIVSAFKNTSSMNPIILLDEIDKISTTNNSNPVENSLLELFDSEQRSSFVDRYLEVPLDLSKAIFICTSNSTSTISKPLLDRLQVINFYDYSIDEKVNIIEDFIYPRIINEYKLNKFNLTLTKSLKLFLAEKYSLRETYSILANTLRRKAKLLFKNTDESKFIDLDFINQFTTKKENSRRIGFAYNFNSQQQKNSVP